MKKTVLIYSLAMAVLISLLKLLEYRFFIHDFSLEFYLGVIALLFTGVGIWLGLKLTRQKVVVVTPQSDFKVNEEVLRQSGLSKREYEVLELMAKGCSNQEIADKLFVSLNTIKTHSSNLFIKLDVKLRTQAIQKAKELALIP